VPGISAAGATPEARCTTAVADAEFLALGIQSTGTYRLPPLDAGLSPVLISRALIEQGNWPVVILDAGLSVTPSVPTNSLGTVTARCISTGQALPLSQVQRLFQAGQNWADRIWKTHGDRYLVIGECVVGGTTTALGVLSALGMGITAGNKVSSSHPICNHFQKLDLIHQGLQSFHSLQRFPRSLPLSPWEAIAALGDPMQPVVAGLMLRASQRQSVLLAGGTQMLATYALGAAIAAQDQRPWQRDAIVVGTTRWVAEDPTSDAPGLAQALNAPLLSTTLNFSHSIHPALQRYEAGYVKEGVGAGGMAIAATLAWGWGQPELQDCVDRFTSRFYEQYWASH
jgi:uncharacterized protein (TIGR00303 family)